MLPFTHFGKVTYLLNRYVSEILKVLFDCIGVAVKRSP